MKAKSLDINQQSTIPIEHSDSKMSIESTALCTKSTMSFENMFDDITEDDLENIQKCIDIEKEMTKSTDIPQTSNQIICSVDCIDVRESDMNTLKGNNLLSDNVEAYMKKLSLLMGEKAYVLSYGMATHIYNNGTTGSQTLRKS